MEEITPGEKVIDEQDTKPGEEVAGGRSRSVEDEDKVREVTKSVLLGVFGEVRRL